MCRVRVPVCGRKSKIRAGSAVTVGRCGLYSGRGERERRASRQVHSSVVIGSFVRMDRSVHQLWSQAHSAESSFFFFLLRNSPRAPIIAPSTSCKSGSHAPGHHGPAQRERATVLDQPIRSLDRACFAGSSLRFSFVFSFPFVVFCFFSSFFIYSSNLFGFVFFVILRFPLFINVFFVLL